MLDVDLYRIYSVHSRSFMVDKMTVEQLIQKLDAIDARDIEVVFLCQRCERYSQIADMKAFGFVKKTKSLLQRLADIMPKKPEPQPNTVLRMQIDIQPIRQAADSFANWIEDDIPQNRMELRAMLWTFGEILNGDMERRMNAIMKINSNLRGMMPFQTTIVDPPEKP